jgi:hypothetical protein
MGNFIVRFGKWQIMMQMQRIKVSCTLDIIFQTGGILTTDLP